MPVSNASLLDLACTAAELADGWTDNDKGVGVSTSETNAPGADPAATVWSFDTNASSIPNDWASRTKDIGSVEGLGNRIVLSVKVYADLLGTNANNDICQVTFMRSDWRFGVIFASDGLYIRDAAAWVEAGTNLVSLDAWQEWTFDIDLSGGVANAVCDIYLDDSLVASDVACDWEGAFTDGNTWIYVYGYTTDNIIAYIDWLKIGDGPTPTPAIAGILPAMTGTLARKLSAGRATLGEI